MVIFINSHAHSQILFSQNKTYHNHIATLTSSASHKKFITVKVKKKLFTGQIITLNNDWGQKGSHGPSGRAGGGRRERGGQGGRVSPSGETCGGKRQAGAMDFSGIILNKNICVDSNYFVERSQLKIMPVIE